MKKVLTNPVSVVIWKKVGNGGEYSHVYRRIFVSGG
jgi:hypothetical protein